MNDSASSSSSSSSSFLNPNDSEVDADVEGISLLREIFPDENIDALRAIHATRLSKCHEDSTSNNSRGNYLDDESSTSSSPLALETNNQLAEMEERVLQEHHLSMSIAERISEEVYYFTAAVHRDPHGGGLGMTLEELPNGNVQVCNLKSSPKNPSANAGIHCHDALIGFNGIAFATSFPLNSEHNSNKTRMKQIVQAIQQSPNPIVLHVQRAINAHSRSLLDAFNQEDMNYVTGQQQQEINHNTVHPFAKVLQKRKLIQSSKEELAISNTIRQFTERARQWESTTSLTTPSTPFLFRTNLDQDHIFREIDMMDGIRKALSTRIVNCFVEEDDRIAYTIWVYDVESGKEWYAPLRYLDDFGDLRAAASALTPRECHLNNLPFPKAKSSWMVTSRRDEVDAKVQQENCRQLETFLRALCRLIYSSPVVDLNLAEIAIHVQSFLGTEAGLSESKGGNGMDHPAPSMRDSYSWNGRKLLKRSIQRYAWRLFQLDTMQYIVDNFVDTALARAPKLQEIESLEAQGGEKLKARSMEELEKIQRFLDELVDLILEGCQFDLKLIARHQEYETIRKEIVDNDSNWDRLVREAVREQVEIEVYVPLRSVVSRLLVNGWRYEDMEIQFKIKELIKRPQSKGTFSIPQSSISPSHWESAALILNRGVGNSTLPCAKLRAIVDASREISRLHVQEHEGKDLIGADNFLPVFIFCVVKANLERPCALCILLSTLCDKMNAIGEIGYFLASFEAVIAHLQEIDLAEDHEGMTNIPLGQISLKE